MATARDRRDYVQFSIGTLFIITTLVAVLASVCRCVSGLVENPLSLFASTAMGLTVGLATALILRQVRLTFLLGILALAFVVINGFWISGGFAVYCLGASAGAMLAWKGLYALNALLRFCGFTVSTVRSPPPSSQKDRRASDGHAEETTVLWPGEKRG